MNMNFKCAEVQLSFKQKIKPTTKLVSSEDCYQFFLSTYDEGEIDYRESFRVVYLNSSLKVVGWMTVATGGITEVLVDPRIVLQGALLTNATLLIACHNHPSGSVRPSKDDDRLTERLKKACEVMNIKMLDHLVITEDSYYSYNDEGRV